MKIETKFNVGQKVWAMKQRWVHASEGFECPVCRGTGYLPFEPDLKCETVLYNGRYTCINGIMHRRRYELTPSYHTIIGFNIDVQLDNYACEYYGDPSFDRFTITTDKDLFLTKEECQVECDRRNNDE